MEKILHVLRKDYVKAVLWTYFKSGQPWNDSEMCLTLSAYMTAQLMLLCFASWRMILLPRERAVNSALTYYELVCCSGWEHKSRSFRFLDCRKCIKDMIDVGREDTNHISYPNMLPKDYLSSLFNILCTISFCLLLLIWVSVKGANSLNRDIQMLFFLATSTKLLQGDTKTFPSQPRDIISPVSLSSGSGS